VGQRSRWREQLAAQLALAAAELRREMVERRVRVAFRETISIPTEIRDRMISVVVEEVTSGASAE
jgi:hypothetical protein